MTDHFTAAPDDLDAYARSLRDLAGQAGTAAGYAGKWFDISAGRIGVYPVVKETVDQIHTMLQTNYQRLQSLIGDSANGIDVATKVYRANDHDRAAQLDGTYPDVPR